MNLQPTGSASCRSDLSFQFDSPRPGRRAFRQMTDVQNRSVVENLLRLMPATSDVCPVNGTYADLSDNTGALVARPFMHERLLASLVANGMSHAAGIVGFWSINQDSTNTSENWEKIMDDSDQDVWTSATTPGLVLTYHGWVSGYGWNLDGIPIQDRLANTHTLLCLRAVLRTIHSLHKAQLEYLALYF